MSIVFSEKNLVREDFMSTIKKTVIENKQAFGGTHAKDYSSKLSLHLVPIYVCPIYLVLKKK